MSSHDHSRFRVVSRLQHPYRHSLTEMAYSNPDFTGLFSNAEDALNYIFNVLYPKTAPSVANHTALLAINTDGAGTQRLVENDSDDPNGGGAGVPGDGNSAMYIWSLWDGEATESWHKLYDLDWGMSEILAAVNQHAQPLYVKKYGHTDTDEFGDPLVGVDIGQHIWGGDTVNQNLSLHANNGDPAAGPGLGSGYVQVNDDFRPMGNLVIDCGTATERFKEGFFGTLTIGTSSLTITSDAVNATISDSSGELSFGNNNLTTTGDGSIGTALAFTGGSASITSASGAISFGNENLTTTGTVTTAGITITGGTEIDLGTTHLVEKGIYDTAGTINFNDPAILANKTSLALINQVESVSVLTDLLDVDNIRVDGNSISAQDVNGNVNIAANGTGVIDLQSVASTLGINTTGNIDASGYVEAGNLRLTTNTLQTSGGDLNLSPATNIITAAASINPSADDTYDLGLDATRWQDLKLSGVVSNGTNQITIGEILATRNNLFRDAGRTLAVQNGDQLFYDNASGTWLAAAATAGVTNHTLLTNLTTGDAGHTQFALLAGRAGGQTVHGSTLTAEVLTLLDNAVDTNGLTIEAASFNPTADAVYDIGAVGARYDDLFMTGEGIGFRAENDTVAGIGGKVNAATPGRLFFGTDDDNLYVDTGGAAKQIGGVSSFNNTYTQVTLLTGIDVSASISDARNALWQVVDVNNGEEIMNLKVTKTATVVTVAVDTPLPAGSYRLIGIQA